MRQCVLYALTICVCFTVCCLTYYQYRDILHQSQFYHKRKHKYGHAQKYRKNGSEVREKVLAQQGVKLEQVNHKEIKPPTLFDVASSVQSPVVLSAINEAFIEITENFILSIRKLNLTPSIVIVCEDKKSYDKISRWENITVVMTHLQLSKSGAEDWRSKAYNKLVDKRVPYILELLKHGKDVFFMDTDIVWLADPFPYVHGKVDIAVIHDYPINKDKKVIYCAGYAYFRNSPAAKFVVHHWQNMLVSPKRKEGSEQQGKFNKAIKKGLGKKGNRKLKLKILPRNLFQAGFEFFNSSTPLDERPVRPVMIHNNWIVGLPPKIERYKKFGLWFVESDRTSNETVSGY